MLHAATTFNFLMKLAISSLDSYGSRFHVCEWIREVGSPLPGET